MADPRFASEWFKNLPPGRCKDCSYASSVRAQDDFEFVGCRHAPYKGKWVAEIKECPKEGEANG